VKDPNSCWLAGLLLAVALVPFLAANGAENEVACWPAAIEQALGKAGSNRSELEKALDDTPSAQRPAMIFLIANMPDEDLLALKADFLLANVDLAYKARRQVPWGQKIPDAIFFNDVLAYANVDEERDAWRQEFYDLCMPLIKDCKTPSEAAQLLNVKVFEKLKVRYSTQRRRPHQSPKETIAQGRASCTGLSILLSDACRSVAIPARLVGTPRWVDQSGNHTWVEIWDQGWHFTGACEQDKNGLDRGWFVEKAGQAQKDVPQHAIYAASFQKTGVPFPLVWAPGKKDVSAENVTNRYARGQAAKDNAPKTPALTTEQLQLIENAARRFFPATAEQQGKWQFDANLDQLLAHHEAAVRLIVWKVFQAAPIHAGIKKDFDANQVRFKDHLSTYTVREVGKRPEKGWPLFIALHGGGNVPTRINDEQWKKMQSYYRDQPSVGGYKYLALRAPNDTWNGFYDEYVPPLVMNLIRQFLLFGNVDPDKVFLMGYSHGGYGAFYIGPKIPDRFAAIHASAAAPTDGTISPWSLRNTRFTFMVGEKDTAYGRRERCEKFSQEIRKLKEEEGGGYPVDFELKQGFGHVGLPDRDKIKEMYGFTRNVIPRHVTWELTDNVLTNHFWLAVARPERGQRLDAALQGDELIITTRNIKEFDLALDGRMIALDKMLQIKLDGITQVVAVRPKLLTLCQSMLRRGDPQLAWTCEIHLGAGPN
jgi:pimeloyl-ACP methyl ester carboxylesterase